MNFIGVRKLDLSSSPKYKEFGFSLLELLVVMAIISVLMGLGVNAFIEFRKSRQVDTLTYAVRDMVKNARSKAMAVSTSSTEASGTWPVGTSVSIESDYIRANVIYDPNDSVVYVPWTGDWESDDVESYNVAEVLPVQVESQGCDLVVFESVNGTMHIYNEGVELGSTDMCEIVFEVSGYSRTLQLQSISKTFEVL